MKRKLWDIVTHRGTADGSVPPAIAGAVLLGQGEALWGWAILCAAWAFDTFTRVIDHEGR